MQSLVLFDKIDNLRKDKGWSVNYLSEQAEISHSTLHNWKIRQTMPSFEVLARLCDALQISLVQAISEDGSENELPEENKKLLKNWSTLNRKQKDLIMDMITFLRGSN